MKSIYDDPVFFEQYAQMSRSIEGLNGAGEWPQFRELFPDLTGKSVLDLGCGYGWHCRYAAEQGASAVLGIDLSEKMIAKAKEINRKEEIVYRVCGMEEYEYPEQSWDCVVSNLALHYIADIEAIFQKVWKTLRPGGCFLLNIEHPVFTAGKGQDWIYNEDGTPGYWPVDDYFYQGSRMTHFLGETVKKEHHTLTQILMGMIRTGFRLDAVEEAMPDETMRKIPGMEDEMRRPMMLLVKGIKSE